MESPTTGATLFTFSRGSIQGNRGWERRNATFTIANTPFGSSPFLSTGAPFAVHQWKWACLFICREVAMSGDAIMDELARAMDLGREVRLVYEHDDGYERICDAIGYVTDGPVDHQTGWATFTLTVTWELLTPWRERAIVNDDYVLGDGLVLGQTPTVYLGELSAAATITSGTFTLPSTMCDASVPGPGGIPTASDTGPVIKLTGPFGGDQGFYIQNFAPLLSSILVGIKLLAGDTLTLDFGAKDYLLNRGGVTTDVSSAVSNTVVGNSFDFAIIAGSTNPTTLFANGANVVTGGSCVIKWQRFFA